MAPKPSSKVCRPTGIAHLVLRTRDPKRLVDFYQKFLNAEMTFSSDVISFMTWDHEHHRLAIINDPSAVPRAGADGDGANVTTCGLDHFALDFSSLGDLLEAYKVRKEMGIEPAYCVNHGISTSMYYWDPDGNKIETQVDAFERPEDAVAFMMGAEFGAGFGPRIDPEELVRRFEAGEDEKMLMKRSTFEKTTTAAATTTNGQTKTSA